MGKRMTQVWKIALILISLLTALNSRGEMVSDVESIYMGSCIACHGSDGTGAMPGVHDLTDPNGALKKSDQELFAVIRQGIDSSSGGIVMPPNGGNKNLTDAEISGLVRYLRTTFGSNELGPKPNIGD